MLIHTKDIAPSYLRWARRDLVIATLFFAATAAFTFWQNSQVAVLWDLGYLLDTSWRIALGQMPYRDFPLVHAPLTFVIQAAIERFAGRNYLFPVFYAGLTGGMGTVFAWRILLRTLRQFGRSALWISIVLTAPLIFLSVYGIYPHPVYDCDCAFVILVAVWSLQRLAQRDAKEPASRLQCMAAGGAVVLTVFFKQNMGLPFLLSVGIGVAIVLIVRTFRRRTLSLADGWFEVNVLAGIAISILFSVVVVHFTAGLHNYLHWTVNFAAERRLPGLEPMFGVYRQPYFLWMLLSFGVGLGLFKLPFARKLWIRILAFSLMAAPFLWAMVFLFLNSDLEDRADSLLAFWPMLLLVAGFLALNSLRFGVTIERLIPFFILAAIHGTFLSQQLWGSTYAIWPLLMLLTSAILASLPRSASKFVPVLAGMISITFLVCGGLYAVGHDRLSYIQLGDGAVHHATLTQLRGMSASGPYLPDFEELVRFAGDEIPQDDSLMLLPGQGPFYYATGRTPRFPVLIFDRTDDPFSPDELMAEARSHHVQWVIVTRRLQLTDDPLPQSEETLALVQKEFVLYRQLDGYDIYRRH